jgi:hypothetical protein
MDGKLDWQLAFFVNDRLIGFVKVVRCKSEPGNFSEEYTACRQVDKSFTSVGIKVLGCGLINEYSCGRIELISEGEFIKINITIKNRCLKSRAEPEVFSYRKLIRILQSKAQRLQSGKAFAVSR